MKINIGKLLGKVAKAAKDNPELALAVVSLAAPGLVRKAAPLIVKAKVAREIAKGV